MATGAVRRYPFTHLDRRSSQLIGSSYQPTERFRSAYRLPNDNIRATFKTCIERGGRHTKALLRSVEEPAHRK